MVRAIVQVFKDLLPENHKKNHPVTEQLRSSKPVPVNGPGVAAIGTGVADLPGGTGFARAILATVNAGSTSTEDSALLAEIRKLQSQGMSPTAIVKCIWGTSSGRSFQRAMAHYKRLTGE
ncbi:hypothetical protein [Leptolyngbya sp. 'hensonii']|uniref:hypothetical protein n=1 Tax=Leptolyngbya sp. 'hensonii' TaxID=1922337 RepID=UPI00117DA2C6|nr:hypothetical protein [Leptolyngbya sp. 'hensonii']